ncbi:MAG: hypothetical protein KJZ80_16275 [Hyphomicrobiaceae bacterium]|nr:hypothetical protein [Hyphomicrobiaceae bacterium]
MHRALFVMLAAGLCAGEPARAASVSRQDVPLSEVMEKTARNPRLQASIRWQLWRAKRTRSDIACSGQQLDSRWIVLGGVHVGPYECAIGSRTVFITATHAYHDAQGRKLSATDPELFVRAARVTESSFRWRWSRTR